MVAQAVAALSALTGNIDVSVGEVNEMLERHSGHPEKSVQQVSDFPPFSPPSFAVFSLAALLQQSVTPTTSRARVMVAG